MPTPNSSPPPPEVRLLRVLYAAQVGLPIALFAVAVALGPSRQAPLAEMTTLRWIGLAAALITTAAASATRSRLDRPRHADPIEHRRAFLLSAIIPWSILEFGGMIQGVIYWLTGDTWMLATFALLFLLPMATMTPSRFTVE